MFNKIFRRGKTKDEPNNNYNNQNKSSYDDNLRHKNYLLNQSYPTTNSKYSNDLSPPWSAAYDQKKLSSQYDHSPTRQNVYTAPPQRPMPFSQYTREQQQPQQPDTNVPKQYNQQQTQQQQQQKFVPRQPQYSPVSFRQNQTSGLYPNNKNAYEPSNNLTSRNTFSPATNLRSGNTYESGLNRNNVPPSPTNFRNRNANIGVSNTYSPTNASTNPYSPTSSYTNLRAFSPPPRVYSPPNTYSSPNQYASPLSSPTSLTSPTSFSSQNAYSPSEGYSASSTGYSPSTRYNAPSNETAKPTSVSSQNAYSPSEGYSTSSTGYSPSTRYNTPSNETAKPKDTYSSPSSPSYYNINPTRSAYAYPNTFKTDTEQTKDAAAAYPLPHNTYNSTNPISRNTKYNVDTTSTQNKDPFRTTTSNYTDPQRYTTANHTEPLKSSYNADPHRNISNINRTTVYPNPNDKYYSTDKYESQQQPPPTNLYKKYEPQKYQNEPQPVLPQYNTYSTTKINHTPTEPQNLLPNKTTYSTLNNNENRPFVSSRNESEPWKRNNKYNNAVELSSSTASGTVPFNVNKNLENSSEHRINDSHNIIKNDNFDRYSKLPSTLSSSSLYSIKNPLIQAGSISAATANLPYNNSDKLNINNNNQSESINIDESEPPLLPQKSSNKKSVKFFNPIDKSRDFLNDIMAKGRNRKTRNNNNSNNQLSQDKAQLKTQVIMSDDSKDFSTNPSEPINKINNNNNLLNNFNNNNNNKNEQNENFNNKTGYQISKSKNSRDIVNKLQSSRATLATAEEDTLTDDNDHLNNEILNKKDEDDEDTDTENTFEENFENNSNNNTASATTTQFSKNSQIKNLKKISDEKKGEKFKPKLSLPQQNNIEIDRFANETENLSEKLFGKNNKQRHHVNSKSSTSVEKEPDSYNKHLRGFADNNNFHAANINNNEQVEKIEKLSELAECDRDNFINNQTNAFNDMGQSQAKPSTSTDSTSRYQQRSRSSSPPSRPTSAKPYSTNNDYAEIYNCTTGKEPVIEEPLSPISPTESFHQFRDSSPEPKILSSSSLPKVTIDDYSSQQTNNVSSHIEPDIFYDFDNVTSNLSPNTSPKLPRKSSSSPHKSRSTSPIDIITLEDIEEEEDEDDWHFVSDNNNSPPKSNNSKSSQNSPQNRNSPYTINNRYSPNKLNHDPDDSTSGLNTPDSGIALASASISNNGKVLVINSCDLVNDGDIQEFSPTSKQSNHYNFSNGSGNVTDCNDNDYEYINSNNNNKTNSNNNSNSIVIDSISLPDVVIETKPKDIDSLGATSLNYGNNNSGSHIINYDNVSKSKSAGNVHFIPIHVEGREETKIQITEETTEFEEPNFVSTTEANGSEISNEKSKISSDFGINDTTEESNKEIEEEIKKRELVNQEARFNAQLQEAQRNASTAQQNAHALQMKIDQLESDLSLKSWNIERLHGEIKAIQDEDTAVKRRLHTIEEEKQRLRQKLLDDEDEFNSKYETLEEKYKELEEKYQRLRQLASNLQTQLAKAKADIDELRQEKDKLSEEKDAELKRLQELLDEAIREQKVLEKKWQKEFEVLRNHNQEHEEQLLTDCEWQLRAMQKQCKERIENAEKAKLEALERVTEVEQKVEEGVISTKKLKSLQAEVRQLRGLTCDQQESLTHMNDQIEELKAELEAANDDLEEKIEEVRQIKLYCQNSLDYKNREMIQKIDDARREVASIWEEKLLTEMTRLTNELEAVNAEDRLEDINHLQCEHIEELKILTNRYTQNEEELRSELEEVTLQLNKKTDEFVELRDKSDVALLTTRLHLDKADREYQQAMNREEEKKEAIVDKLQKEFDLEKEEMEADFQERIAKIKEDFAKELSNQTHDIAKKHRIQLEQQWDQLVAEKEDALQALEKRHRIRMEDQEMKMKQKELQHLRDLKELKSAYDMDHATLQNRDIHNSQEIEQLHRKCRCLTNLFEEMRLRYERREPRPEDLREIAELRARCDSQERDLCDLTERLRDLQIQMEEMSSGSLNDQHRMTTRKGKPIRKPPPKTIPISCDVIYEENEERESSPSSTESLATGIKNSNSNGFKNGTESSEDDDEEEEEEDEEEENTIKNSTDNTTTGFIIEQES